MRIALLLVLFALSYFSFLRQSSAEIDPGPLASDAITAFEGWLKKNQIAAGAIAVSYKGQLIAAAGVKRTENTPAPVASLSKAITAVCAIKLLAGDNKPLSTTLAEAMPDLFTENPAIDKKYRQITLAQLISQDSGIHSGYSTEQLPNLNTFTQEVKHWQWDKITAEPLAASPGSGHYYSNANYLILGMVIEAVSGENYEEYCRATVLDPLGIRAAKLNPDWRVMSSYGGWKISALDYLTFIDAYFPDNTIMGENPLAVVFKASAGSGAWYGPGIYMRAGRSGGFNFWHAGSWRWKNGRIDDRFGAYFAAYDNGVTVSVNYDHDAFDGQQDELDTLLYKATHPR